MADIQLAINAPDVATISTTVQRYLTPAEPSGAAWVRIYSAAECYLVQHGTITDGAALGTDFETIPAATQTWRLVRRGEFGVAGSASQDVEVTASTREGPG